MSGKKEVEQKLIGTLNIVNSLRQTKKLITFYKTYYDQIEPRNHALEMTIKCLVNNQILFLIQLYNKSDNEKYSFHKLLNVIENKLLLKAEVAHCRKILEYVIKGASFKRILEIRDWYIAHQDLGKDKRRMHSFELDILSKQAEVLFTIISSSTGESFELKPNNLDSGLENLRLLWRFN